MIGWFRANETFIVIVYQSRISSLHIYGIDMKNCHSMWNHMFVTIWQCPNIHWTDHRINVGSVNEWIKDWQFYKASYAKQYILMFIIHHHIAKYCELFVVNIDSSFVLLHFVLLNSSVRRQNSDLSYKIPKRWIHAHTMTSPSRITYQY